MNNNKIIKEGQNIEEQIKEEDIALEEDIKEEHKKEENNIIVENRNQNIENKDKIEKEKIQSKKEENKINEKSLSNSNIIKKPVMTEEEYQKMMKKRNIMKKYSKYKPMSLLFGKQGKVPVQNNQNNINNTNYQNNYTINMTSPNLTNPNLQINNYTTYLTSIETIAEEKYQKDGQTLIIENPNFSVKQLNYKYKINQLNKIMIIYIRKINEIEDKYNFTNQYLFYIIKIFEKISYPYIFSLSLIFKNDIKPNLKYFNEISPIFAEFSEKMQNIQNKLLESNNINKKKENEITYMNNNLNESVQKLNNIYANNFSNTSKNIQNLIINNPLYAKIDTIENKFTDNYNKIVAYINKLIHRRQKFNDKYQKDTLPFFTGIKERLNDTSFYQYLTMGKDFIFIENSLISYINKIYSKISQFLINMEIILKDSHNIFYDYLELLNNIIKLFYIENKNILNMPSLLPNKSILNLDNLIKTENIRKTIEKNFSFKKIIENNDNEKLFNEINHFLLNYRDLLLQYNFVKNVEIEEVINFNLIKYNNVTNFIQFLMKLIPSKITIAFKEVIELKLDVKRNPGILKGWKDCLLIITYQGHIYIFDKEAYTDIAGSQNKKITRKDIINSIIEEDNIKNKKEEINENEDLYLAIKNNKLIANYWRNNFGIAKYLSNDNKKLIQLYEDYMGFRQYRPIIIDVINDNNLNNLINTISLNKFL